MSLTHDDVNTIARLARLELSPAEADETLSQLQDIFGVIERMQAIDTRAVEPLTTPLAAVSEVVLRMREDIVTEPDQRDALMKVAPAQADGLYLVPRVVE